jgi:hypothetical protein
MASWNNCPYEIRRLILSEFSQSLIDDAHRLQSMCDVLQHPPPYPALPNPWKAFKSALLVNHDFSSILGDIKIHESSLTKALWTEQKACLRMVLSNQNLARYRAWQQWHESDEGVQTALETAMAFAGHFWKNFDVFDGSWNFLSALRFSIGAGEENAMMRYLMPFLQYIDQALPPSAEPVTRRAYFPFPHLTYQSDALYYREVETCVIERIVGFSRAFEEDLLATPTLESGEWGVGPVGAAWRAAVGSSPRQWLLIHLATPPFKELKAFYFVNTREKRCFKSIRTTRIGETSVFGNWQEISQEIN